jgi:hypothetical protein
MSQYKVKVTQAATSAYSKRFFQHLWSYRMGQLTTGNIAAMKKISIGASEVPVFSDLQPHGIHKFRCDKSPSLLVAVPKSSTHSSNLKECSKVSFMAGHTDPQIYHWFKLLGTIPPRSIVSGKFDVMSGDLLEEAWSSLFVKHPVIHEMAAQLWANDETKTPEEKEAIEKREKEEDEKRMHRMSSADWRGKHSDRERSPTKDEDEETPIYVMKQSSFDIIRILPEVQLFGDYGNELHRVWEQIIPGMDPLARCAPRYIRMANTSRAKLVAALNVNYSLQLTNCFIFDLDNKGLWAMGTQENFKDDRGHAKEEWTELRVEFGKDQTIETEQELEWWFKGLMRLGVPETGTTSGTIEESSPDFQPRN